MTQINSPGTEQTTDTSAIRTVHRSISRQPSDKTELRPVRLNVPESELTELRLRIKATRWPDRETDASQGVQLATMQELARYWATDCDWRKVEARLNTPVQTLRYMS